MSHLLRLVRLAVVLLALVAPSIALAQTSGQRGRLIVTVTDPSGGVVPDASVALTGLDAATKAATLPAIKTTDKGVATFDGLTPGRYSITAEFPGFDLGLLRDIKVNRGDNKHVVVLPLKGRAESVTVGPDGQAAAATRSTTDFGLSATKEQIDALSDDPAEMQRQILEIAGPDAVIRVDSFEGQQLPPKSQIKSIHVTRDQFAAETEQPGSTFVDVITQPGVGPIRGGANFSFRDGSMTAKSPFTPTKGAEQYRGFGGNVGGALVKNKSNFSLSVNGQDQYSTPNLNAVTLAGAQAEALTLRQPSDNLYINGLLDYALTKDQTLRFGYSQYNQSQTNLGVGGYDYPERAFSRDNNGYTFRALEAGPIGRRFFINTRMTISWNNFGAHSSFEAPTVIVQDAFTRGGAQQAGRVHNKDLTFASDLDYVRGIHSWRTGVIVYADWYHADLNNNYLGTFTFSSLTAYEAGTPLVYRRSIGDPVIDFFTARGGAYFQDDIRVRKGLTLSPGLRYSLQSRVDDFTAFEPRLGVTWAPGKTGATTFRLSGGIFHGSLDPGVWWQTVRYDGDHQRELIIVNPPYPDPGAAGVVPPVNQYKLGSYKLNKNIRYSGGIDQKFSPRFGINVLYNYYDQVQLPRGTNLNPLVNGVRPNPDFANIIQTVTDAELIRHELYVNFNFSLAGPGPAANSTYFNWRRLTVNGSYSFIRAQRNAFGPFDVPPSGNLADEWGNGPADNPYRVSVGITSTQVRNFNLNLLVTAADGYPYNLTTGFDDNQDGLINDRPAGVGMNSLRAVRTYSLNLRVAYQLPMGSQGPGAAASPGAPQRYRTSLYVNVSNLTNHANLTGFSGVMTSPYFMQATAVQNPRRVDMGMNIAF